MADAASDPNAIEVLRLIREELGYDNERFIIHFETLWRDEKNSKLFDWYLEQYRHQLTADRSGALRRKLYADSEKIIRIYQVLDANEFEKLNLPAEMTEYFGLCSPDEMRRLLAPKDAADDLLRIRADSILDNTRRARLAARQYQRQRTAGVAQLFNDTPFHLCLNHLPKHERALSQTVAAGFTYEPKANGYSQAQAREPKKKGYLLPPSSSS